MKTPSLIYSTLVLERYFLTQDILFIRLKPQDGFGFQAGMYVFLGIGEEATPLSIANAPNSEGTLDFHIRIPSPQHWLAQLTDPLVKIRLSEPQVQYPPFDKKAKKFILLAAGTGLAPMMSLVEQWQNDEVPRPLWLYHGAKSQAELYLDERLRSLEALNPEFHYHSCLSQAPHPCEGYVQELMIDHHDDLSTAAIYICGPWGMKDEIMALTRDNPPLAIY